MIIKSAQTICNQIEIKLKNAFPTLYLLVLNESNQHNVPQDSESHFKVILVTDKFISQSMIARHKAVYQVLADELLNHIHALSLRTYTSIEWQKHQYNNMVFNSPKCCGKDSK